MSKQQSSLVSVCIPVFNGEEYLTNCINSVLEQSYTNYELLIVDNCSTDATSKIINNISDKRVIYIRNEKNIGSIKNFNKCIKEAQGEYFILLPHDDLLLPGSLEKFVSKFDEPKVGFAYSSIRVVDDNGDVKYSKINHTESKLFSGEDTIFDIVENFVPIQLAMARTEILQRLDGFDMKFGLFCDVHLWLNVVFDGWKSSYICEPLSCHRVHAQQGQNAFRNSDLKTLSMHWGRKLDRSFFIENSYNSLFLKLISFLLQNAAAQRYDIKDADTILLKLFAKLHLRSLFLALLRFNVFIFHQELVLFKSIIKWYGFKKILLYYPYVILYEIKKKLDNKIFRYVK